MHYIVHCDNYISAQHCLSTKTIPCSG